MKKIQRFFIHAIGLTLWVVLGINNKLYWKAADKLNKRYLELI